MTKYCLKGDTTGYGWQSIVPCCLEKELTDEEINEIVWQQNLLLGNDDLRKFARAILKKAQEK